MGITFSGLGHQALPQGNIFNMTTLKIDNLSPLAQGVSKSEKGITFVTKTLPNEVVKAKIVKRKKQLQFAACEKIIEASEHRIEPECEHFNQCSGCHYLHTSYEQELAFKKQALEQYSNKLNNLPEIEVIASPQRLHYRNRVQLHYRHKHLGVIDTLNDKVLPIPQCKIFRPELQTAIDDLYQDKSWAKSHQGRGHVEVYWQDNEVKTTWNESYASGGFSQVNEAINDKVCAQVTSWLEAIKPNSLLDIFSGSGNLSNAFMQHNEQCSRTMLDFSEYSHPDFLQMNLLESDSLQRFMKRQPKKKYFECLLVDPPRKGFAALNEWVTKLKPKQLIYVACDPVTLMRDIQSLSCRYKVESIQLYDMFPGTYHFETVVKLSLKY